MPREMHIKSLLYIISNGCCVPKPVPKDLSDHPPIMTYSIHCSLRCRFPFQCERKFFPENKISGDKALPPAIQDARTVTYSCPSSHVIIQLGFPMIATSLHLLGLVV